MPIAKPCYAYATARARLRLSFPLLILLSLMATAQAQDIAAGKQVFGKCGPCHAIGPDAPSKVGPPLNGLFGRKAATQPGFFGFSAALKNSGITWDDQSFQEYIANPRQRVPGGKMTFAGIEAPQKIRDLAAYLKLFDVQGQMAAAVPAPPPAPVDEAGIRCRQALGTDGAEKACADVGGAYLQAVGVLLASLPSDGAGVFDKVGLTQTDGETEGSRGTRLVLSVEDPCVIEVVDLTRGKEAWASTPSLVDNLHKVRGLRPITKMDDLATRARAAIEDPAVVAVLMEGDGVACEVAGGTGTGKPPPSCMGYILLNAYGPENKAALFKALPVVRKACNLPE